MSQTDFFDMPEVTAILDHFYADKESPEQEPDWDHIHDLLFNTSQPLYSLTLNLLKAVWWFYEDPQSGLSRIYAEKHGL